MAKSSYPPFHPDNASKPFLVTIEQFRTAFPSESSYVEWKAGVGGTAIQKAVVAFSNADGGVLMIGVDDRGRPMGKSLDEGLERRLWEIVNHVESPGSIEMSSLTVDQVEIAVVSVGRRHQGVAQTSDGTVLIRRGKQNLPLTGTALMGLVAQRVQDSFESSLSRWKLSDADPELLASLCTAFELGPSLGEQDRTDALEERGMVVHRSGEAVLTKAGALFLVRSAPSEFGKCFVEVFRFQEDRTEHDRRVTFEGTPAQQVDGATAWIDDELGFDLVVVGRRRHELRRLPIRALRETIANAVAHRDYQLSGSAVEVRMTPHEVVVTSPGGFVAPVTSQNLQNAHAARNRRIIQALRSFRLAEDAGRGIGVILHEMAEDLRSEPSFAEQPDGHVTVRLPIESPISPEERAWTRELQDRAVMLSEDRRVLIEAARGTELTNAVVRSLLNIDSATARQSLQRLRDAGLLEQDGERRGARYRIVPGLRRPVWIGLDRVELCSTILDMAVHGSVTNSMVRQELGLSRNEAVALLRGLVAEGLLELRGSKRGSHYVLAEPA